MWTVRACTISLGCLGVVRSVSTRCFWDGRVEIVQIVCTWGCGTDDMWGWGRLGLCDVCSIVLEYDVVLFGQLGDG